MRLACDWIAILGFDIEPVRQLIAIGVRVIVIATLFDDQLTCVWAIASRIPAEWLLAEHALKYVGCTANVLTFRLAVHILISDPA